ncbi:MAG TPA: DegT/DnrJ/EryC1/StrS family aminotransferase [Candidatus Dormibacteraeota bacterium]|nr:DegT/DnrJ/EryC1/StrS family aminotransferase [Candidatus Dormibacteraeota bacterium]
MKEVRSVAKPSAIAIAHPFIGEEEKRAVMRVLESGQLAQGPVVAQFEEEFARWCGVKHAVAVSSGTAGLHLALLAHGIGPGDEVITSPFTFIASGNSVLFTGATPVFVDVELDTFCIDPSRVEAAITPRTRAIMPVHLYGYPASLPELAEIARQRGLFMVEDAAQAHGATVVGKKVGTFGNTAVFSLYPTKNMMAGEGGLVTTDDDRIASAVRMLRQHGESERYHHRVLGYNFRMTDLCAAIALVQLHRVDGFNAARRRNAEILSSGLAGVPGVVTPTERPDYEHVYHQYTIRVEDQVPTRTPLPSPPPSRGRGMRDRLKAALAARGIGTGIYYPIPLHRQQVYVDRGYGDQSFPMSERLAGEVLSLPVHPALSDADLARVVESIREELKG